MPGTEGPTSPIRLCALLCLILAIGLAPDFAHANDDADGGPALDGYAENWTGAYVGVALFGGPSWGQNEALTEGLGWAVGVSTRVNMVLSLLDAQLDYRMASYTADFQDQPLGIRHHALGTSLGIHPFFLANFGANRFYYMLASTYLQLGFTLNFTELEWQQTRPDADVNLGYFLGAGTDFPITDPDAGGGIWFGALYRFTQTRLDASPFVGEDFCEHLLGGNLSYRHNGLFF